MEIDGFYFKHKLAVEFQGKQHYHIVAAYDMTKKHLEYQQQQDKLNT